NQNNYSPEKAPKIAQQLLAMPEPWLALLEICIQTGILPESPRFEEFNLPFLVEQRGYKIPAAFLTMQWLEQNPETFTAILRTGQDRIHYSGGLS
ncbi:MAG TPA: hypothetical protein PKX41_14350, partial [Anaerolineaceae bacterium]|nr:hypothetical protein [Anaerolineaceae bacterium]